MGISKNLLQIHNFVSTSVEIIAARVSDEPQAEAEAKVTLWQASIKFDTTPSTL